jgi:hypothetical protein
MTKSELAKKTAKLMVDKLSPQELENELYQLLIMLSTDNVEYVRDDIKKGNIAGTPLPITSLVIEDYDLSRGDSMHQYEDEDDRHPVDELQGSDDRVDDEDESWRDKYDVIYQFDDVDNNERNGADYPDEFRYGDDIYIYDKELDRWIQHEIIESTIGTGADGYDNIQFIVEPIHTFGPRALLMGPFTEKEVKKKGEHSPIYEDNYIDSELIDKIESHPDVKKAWMDDFLGVVYMEFEEWNGPEFNYEITIAATPGWEEEDEIPVQVDVEERDTGDFHNYSSKNNVSMRDSQVFITEQGVYPSKEQYHQIYYDKIDDIKRVAEGTLDEEKLIN